MAENDKYQQAIKGYDIIEKIGQGGMGNVFKARRSKTGQIVAIKVLYPHHNDNAEILDRFEKEGRLMLKFRHINIVEGYELGISHGLHYLAMEYVNGVAISEIMKKKGLLPPRDALKVVHQIARALKHIEEHRYIHRDLKLDNILVTKTNIIKLCDFGFARPIDEPDPDESEGWTCGTPQYVSPEQARAEIDLDIRTDIYSLGITFYYMLTGDFPFKGKDYREILRKHNEEEPPPIYEMPDEDRLLPVQRSTKIIVENERDKKLLGKINDLIMKMLAKDKNDRHKNTNELIREIKQIRDRAFHQPIRVSPKHMPQASLDSKKRRRSKKRI